MFHKSFADGFTAIVIEHEGRSLAIFLREEITIPDFQIIMLEKFFRRLAYLIARETQIDVIAEPTQDDLCDVIAYLYNHNLTFDFSTVVDNPYTGLHLAISALMNLAIYSDREQCSINEYADEITYDYDEENETNGDDESETEISQKPESPTEKKLRRAIDEILKRKKLP